MKNFLRQRLSFKEKTKDDNKWVRDNIDSICTSVPPRKSTHSYISEFDRMLSNYQLYNNQLNQSDFERECNPLGIEVGQFRDAIQPYNKTYNKVQSLLSDELRRPYNYKAVLTNSDGIRSKMMYRDVLLKEYVLSQVQTTIQGVSQYSPELVEASPMDPKQIDEYMSTTYLESREILANKLLTYFNKALSIPELKNDAFKHALISGIEAAYVGVRNGEPYIEILNPLGLFYHKSPEIKYIQDGLFAGYRTYMTSGDVLDQFGQYLSQDEIKEIDGSNSSGFDYWSDRPYFDPSFYQNYFIDRTEGSYSASDTVDDWLVTHAEWRSQQRVGFITFINEYGDDEMDMVNEDFEPPAYATKYTVDEAYEKKCTYYTWKDATGTEFNFKWTWVPQVWSGVRIGESIYTMLGPKPYQHRSVDNPFKVPLGYHGVAYSSMNADPISLMDRMKPYQYLYFIIMHKMKRLIAQDKGRVFALDSTMIDPKLGWDKTIYYLTEANLDIYNPLANSDQPGWAQRSKVTNSIDMSTAQHIMNYVQLLASIDQQISDVAGVSRSKEGQISPDEAVTNAQNNAAMSAAVMEIYFSTHDKLWEQILSSFVQTTTSCYKYKGTIKQFMLDDMSLQTIKISPDDFLNSDFGIFVTNSAKEEYLYETLKSLGQALVQNDKAKFSDMIRLLKSSSVEELERQIVASEKQFTQEQMAQQEQQLQAQAQMQQAQQEFELEMQRRDHENKIKIAEIDSFKFQMDQDVDDDGTPDQFEIEKFKIEAGLKGKKLQLEEVKLKEGIRQKDEEIAIKKKIANKPTPKKSS